MTREEAIEFIAQSVKSDVDMAFVADAIQALEQEPRKGHWISHREHCEMNNLLPSGLGSLFWCSNCDCGIDSEYFHRVNFIYCPNCGCRMVEPQESDIEKRKPCINYEDGCEEWAGCPCVYYKAESEDKE